MNAKPIIFSSPMVRALLAGKKTQTRRIVKPQPEHGTDCPYHIGVGCQRKARVCPYGSVGDLLWVKEAWAAGDSGVVYRADFNASVPPKWKSPLYMPLSASRLILRITGVNIEELHDIGELDAMLEGTQFACDNGIEDCHRRGYEAMYAELWERIHGVGSWTRNPWVWRLKFEVIQQNADGGLSAHSEMQNG